MIYASPVPSEYILGQYYDQTGADYYLSPAKLEGDYSPVRFERELKIFRTYCPNGAVLDVGCSSGAFLYQLKKRFADSYQEIGTDVSGPALDYAESRGIEVIRGDFLEQDFAGRTFHAITFWAVLEHLGQPRLFLEKAASLLKTGGYCFVLVPNMDSLAARTLGMRYRYIYPQHLNYFTRKTLSELVSKSFTVVHKETTHFNPIILLQDWKRGNREVSNAERGALLRRTTAYKQNPLFRPLRWLYRTTEKVLGSLNLADNLVFVLRK